MSNYRNTNNDAITQAMINQASTIEILSGEGETGYCERYSGARTVRAVRARLTRERCAGERWAQLILDGDRV